MFLYNVPELSAKYSTKNAQVILKYIACVVLIFFLVVVSVLFVRESLMSAEPHITASYNKGISIQVKEPNVIDSHTEVVRINIRLELGDIDSLTADTTTEVATLTSSAPIVSTFPNNETLLKEQGNKEPKINNKTLYENHSFVLFFGITNRRISDSQKAKAESITTKEPLRLINMLLSFTNLDSLEESSVRVIEENSEMSNDSRDVANETLENSYKEAFSTILSDFS